jgi:hypothetical protein
MVTFVAELELEGIYDDKECELKDCNKKTEFSTQNSKEHFDPIKILFLLFL